MVNSTIELTSHHADIAKIVNDNMRDIEEALCLAIEKGQKNGQFSNANSARSLARFLSIPLQGCM